MEFLKSLSSWWLALVVPPLSFALLGCGATPTNAPPAPPQIPVTGDIEERAVPPEAPEPAEVEALFYLKNPAATAQALASLLDDQPAEQSLPLDLKALVEAALGPELANMIDLTQPMQFALLHEAGQAAPVSAYSLGLLAGSASEPQDLEFGRQCVRQSDASSKARFVCVESGAVTDSVLALFDRAAKRTFAGDLLVEVPKEAIERIETEDDPVPQSPAAAFGTKLGNELMDAFGGVAFELTLPAITGDQLAELAVEVEVQRTSGFFATLLVGDAPTPLPPEFNGLPADANLGLTLSGLEPDVMTDAAEPVWREFEADLARYHPRARVTAMVAELRQLVFTGGPLLLASGPPGPAQARLAQQAKDPQTQRLALQGWWSFGVKEPLERWALGLEKLIELDHKQFPLAPDEPAKEIRAPTATVTIVRKYPVPANSGLPKGSLHFRIWNTRNPDYVLGDGEEPPLETTTYVYVSGKPPTTWIVGSEHDRLALAKARELILAREASLHTHFFRPPKAGAARLLGFTTLKALAMHFLPTNAQSALVGSLDLLGEGVGATEFALRYSVVARDASRFARFSVGVPSEIVQGLVGLGLPLALIRWTDPSPPATPP